MRSRKPSAALVLGVFSGVLAAIAVMPTAIPLSLRLSAIEEALVTRQVQAASVAALRMVDRGEPLGEGSAAELQVDSVAVLTGGQPVQGDGLPLAVDVLAGVCAEPDGFQQVRHPSGALLVTRCVSTPTGAEIVVGSEMAYTTLPKVLYLVLLLAALVGIVTALGVLRLLAPISRVSRALERVQAGERGVRLTKTGLSELDELVERLNATAKGVEAREQEVLEHIKTVQEMARMVAHEVRNPLQSLELLASLVASEDDADERHELARAIHAEIRGLDMVVTRLLREGAFTGALRLVRVREPIGPMLHQVMTLRKTEAAAHGVTLELDDRAPGVTLDIDRALLGRSLENLVLNAMQYVPATDGRITVEVWDDPEEVHVAVADNGPGVDPDLASHIFDANVSGRTGGTGLGLTLVRTVIQAHGGTIAHERSKMGGARFVVHLPKEDDGTQVTPGARGR